MRTRIRMMAPILAAAAAFAMQGTALTGAQGMPQEPCSAGDAAWSPDGDRIALSASCDYATETSDVFIVNADGSAPMQLTHGGYSHCVQWSPDGAQLAFQSDREGVGNVFVLRLSDNDLRNLTHDDSPDGCPLWSPDGTQLLYTLDDGSGQGGDLRLGDLDGTHNIRLNPDGTAVDVYDWSPDGVQIAFASTEDMMPGGDIYIVERNGTGLRNLTQTEDSLEACPVWSPDGTRIAFSATGEYDDWHFEVMNADGSGRVVLSAEQSSGVFPVCGRWSPDGQQLMFDVAYGMQTRAFLVSLEDRQPSLLVPVSDRYFGRITGWGWSPDGKKMLYRDLVDGASLFVTAGGKSFQVFPPP